MNGQQSSLLIAFDSSPEPSGRTVSRKPFRDTQTAPRRVLNQTLHYYYTAAVNNRGSFQHLDALLIHLKSGELKNREKKRKRRKR